jgi:hypothetical protein
LLLFGSYLGAHIPSEVDSMSDTSAKRNSKMVSCLLIFLVAILLGILGLVGAGIFGLIRIGDWLNAEEKGGVVTVQPKVVDGKVEFSIHGGKNIRNMDGIEVYDDKETLLWKINNPGNEKPEKMVYGELPKNTETPWKQEKPEENKPPEDIRGKRVVVKISSRVQSWFGLGSQTNEFTLDIPK